MQNKGFISTIAVLLILICGFYISFSFITSHYEKEAKEYAARIAGTDDVTNDVYKQSLKQYNDSIDKEKVWLGLYTYNQARKMEMGLGLDLKGGMNVVLEISMIISHCICFLFNLLYEAIFSNPFFSSLLVSLDFTCITP